jgi:uncharacterized iron-regulated membrane protein
VNRLRKVIFWCHLAAGVSAGVIILIMSVTGVLLAYERQLTRWADMRDYKVAPPATPASSATRLPLEALVARAREGQAAAPASVTLYNDANAPAVVAFAGGRNLYVDPYTGEPFGEGAPRVRAFFRTVTDWHRWLGAGTERRAAGRALTGAANLVFLFIVASGFYLWWPRKWTRAQFRNVAWFRRGLSGKARDFNWHNTVGIWMLVPLFVVVLSAVVISYTWASNLVYRVAGEAPPAQPQRGASGGAPGNAGQAQPGAAASLEGIDRLWARAEQQVEGWRSISMRVPDAPNAPVVFSIDRGDGGQPQKRAQLTLNRATGEVVRWEPYSSYTTGRRLRSWLRFAHTGEVYGVAGQTVAALASAAGALLVYTGLALAWRRLRAWRQRRGERGRRGERTPAQVSAP